jgi:hypothetical protein
VLLEAKHLHPSWEPRKILPYLARPHPALELPAASSAGELFRNAGLSRSKPRRRRPQHPGAPTLHAGGPNEVWTADFKGQFRTGDGGYCCPLTVADAYSRSLLGSRPEQNGRHERMPQTLKAEATRRLLHRRVAADLLLSQCPLDATIRDQPHKSDQQV